MHRQKIVEFCCLLTENVGKKWFYLQPDVVKIVFVLKIITLKGVWKLIYEVVLYKGLRCNVVFDYGNGNLEILCLDEVLLVHEGQIDRLH